ncbi:MAG: hypothetical protein ACOYXS_03150 [Chloroflexota bacterium]
MGDLGAALGQGFSTFVSRSLDIVGGIIGGIAQTMNGILPGSAILALVGLVVAVFVFWSVRRP